MGTYVRTGKRRRSGPMDRRKGIAEFGDEVTRSRDVGTMETRWTRDREEVESSLRSGAQCRALASLAAKAGGKDASWEAGIDWFSELINALLFFSSSNTFNAFTIFLAVSRLLAFSLLVGDS